jgi:hypothetical protein
MIPYNNQIDTKHNNIISAIFIYLGGFFLLSALDSFFALTWFELNNFFKIILTLGIGIIAYTTSIFLFIRHKSFHFAVMLYIISTIQLIIGLFVLANIFGFLELQSYLLPLESQESLILTITMNTILIFGIITIQQFITYYYLKPNEPIASILLLSFIFLTSYIFHYFSVPIKYSSIISGVLYLTTMHLFTNTVFKKSSPLWNFIGCINLFIGAHILSTELNATFIFYIVCAIALYLSLIQNSLTLLYVSIFTVALYTINITANYFIQLLGWSMTLVLYALSFMIISLIITNIGSIRSTFIKNKENN